MQNLLPQLLNRHIERGCDEFSNRFSSSKSDIQLLIKLHLMIFCIVFITKIALCIVALRKCLMT